MFIAHLPAGYLMGRLVQRTSLGAPWIIPSALVGSVAPDFDLLYFHLVDGGRTHHHHYVTHMPLFWAAVAALNIVTSGVRVRACLAACLAFFLGIFSHMVLDSIAAPTYWLAPFSELKVELFPVPATYSHWIVSFVLHWTFLIEIGITLLAVIVLAAGRSAKISAHSAP